MIRITFYIMLYIIITNNIMYEQAWNFRWTYWRHIRWCIYTGQNKKCEAFSHVTWFTWIRLDIVNLLYFYQFQMNYKTIFILGILLSILMVTSGVNVGKCVRRGECRIRACYRKCRRNGYLTGSCGGSFKCPWSRRFTCKCFGIRIRG